MKHLTSPHVQVILSDGRMPPALGRALDRTGARVTASRFRQPQPFEPRTPPDLVVMVVPHDQRSVQSEIEGVLTKLADKPCGTLIMTDAPLNGLASLARPPALPVTFAVNPSEEELTARLHTMWMYCDPLRHIRKQMDDHVQQEQWLTDRANHRDEQLRLAGQVQRDFLPQSVPRCAGVRFATLYRPADYVSGDIYDIVRLDETHIGVQLIDVAGHGVPAALLTLFVKHVFRAKEIVGSTYRIMQPDELLHRLNREVIEADLQQCQFVTASFAIYDQERRTLTWARGGLPYPIAVRPGEPARQLRTSGDLVGAFDTAHFEVRTESLRPGDAVLFFTDGLEALLLMGERKPWLDHLTQSEWFRRLGTRSIEADLDEINNRLDEAAHRHWPRDDVTVVALCVEE